MTHTFEIAEDFLLDGKPFKIISGAVHYFRIPPAYWEDRLRKLRAMGCNTVETYIPWNLHEPEPGTFNFSGILDIAAFVRLAQKLGLWVILRPSPYICAEWEFGGLPAWLLREDGMRLRGLYPPFMEQIKAYYQRLFPEIVPLQVDHGGPVILMQVENEYGYYGEDTAYLQGMERLMRDCGATVPFVTSDGPMEESLSCGHLPGVRMIGIDDFEQIAQENRIRKQDMVTQAEAIIAEELEVCLKKSIFHGLQPDLERIRSQMSAMTPDGLIYHLRETLDSSQFAAVASALRQLGMED